MTQTELISKVQENTPALECECGAEANDDGEGLNLIGVTYPDSSEILYTYECLECGKEVKETFLRVKVEVSEI